MTTVKPAGRGQIDAAAEVASLADDLRDIGNTWRDYCPVIWPPECQQAFERWAMRHFGSWKHDPICNAYWQGCMSWPLRVIGKRRHEVNGHVWESDKTQPFTRQELEAAVAEGTFSLDERLTRWFDPTAQ